MLDLSCLLANRACQRAKLMGPDGKRRMPFGRLTCNRRPLCVETLEDRRLLAVDLALLKDINTVPVDSGADAEEVIDVNGIAFFSGGTPLTGIELWKSDGTEAGTVRVKDINGPVSSNPENLTNVGGTLYFTAFDLFGGGRELWKSDGTEAVTVRVKDVQVAHISYLTNVAGTLYFRANDGSSGYELWKSDGTDTGTVLVEDLTGDMASASPRFMTLVGDRLFVVADNDAFGSEIWSGTLGSLQGDFDRNGLLELADVDALVSAIAVGAHPLHFDLDNDALVTKQDLDRWLELGGAANLPSGNHYRPGDANLDGLVGGSDFDLWNANKFTFAAAWSSGDFNADGQVDGSDFGIRNANKLTASVAMAKRLRRIDTLFANLVCNRG